MKTSSCILLLLASLVLAPGQESSPKPLAEMSEEEAFSQLLKSAGIPEVERSRLDGSLEEKGWELINSGVDEGPLNKAAIGNMIQIVGLHPSSGRYSAEQARILLQKITPSATVSKTRPEKLALKALCATL